MKIQIAILLAMLFCMALVAGSQSKATDSVEQLRFKAGSRVNKAAVIPEDVLVEVKRDKMVEGALENPEVSGRDFPNSWFSVSAAHLRSSEEADLIVVGQGPLVSIGETIFWVFRPTANGHELIFTGYGRQLDVLETRSQAYHDIEVLSPNGPDVHRSQYQFDGHFYQVGHESYEPANLN